MLERMKVVVGIELSKKGRRRELVNEGYFGRRIWSSSNSPDRIIIEVLTTSECNYFFGRLYGKRSDDAKRVSGGLERCDSTRRKKKNHNAEINREGGYQTTPTEKDSR